MLVDRGVAVVTRLILDEIMDASEARVIVERDAAGRVTAASFDLVGLPRVDSLLVGRPVASVPSLVERLCGICPAAHHLAGVRALESLAGAPAPTPTADAVRRLLHHGSALATQTPRPGALDPVGASVLRDVGRRAMAAAGSPHHFPTTAVPGGVRTPVSPDARDDLRGQVDAALEVAIGAANRLLATGTVTAPYAGADVALADENGVPDLLGCRLRAVAADGSVLEHGASPDRWDALIAEAAPGRSAPRPYLVALGPELGRYRVGPVAQLRIGPLSTPIAAGLQRAWLAAQGGAGSARAIMAVHAVEAIDVLLAGEQLIGGELTTPGGGTGPDRAGVGIGWVDGPRGLLVHRYATTVGGTLTAAMILTPTAQNEPWLAELLRVAADAPESESLGMEDAIREADPCLPCTSAPPGGMGLRIDTVTAPSVPTSSKESD
jgi:NAD-reducing hydrogenase large subunit